MEKPGTWFSMSSAVRGAKRVKSAGVKTRLPVVDGEATGAGASPLLGAEAGLS
jgi:hypothetical protein